MSSTSTEYRLLVPRAEARDLAALLDTHIVRHRYWGEADSCLPNARQYATTIYFDTPDHLLYRRALMSPQASIKLRARERYDYHPDLVETAADSAELYRHEAVLWLELKDSSGEPPVKHRVGVPRGQVHGFLHAPHGRRADALASFVAAQGPFDVTAVVNYRRTAWSGGNREGVRATLDCDLAVFASAPEQLQGGRTLVRAHLGAPFHVEPGVIAELSLGGDPPPWLAEWLTAHQSRAMRGGKFMLACGHLYPEISSADSDM